MNARELHGTLSKFGVGVMDPEMSSTILRALDLLARVEESEDELVRMCEAASRDERLADGMLYRKAAAALVALRAERDRVSDTFKVTLDRLILIKAERDRLKAQLEKQNA